MQNKRKGQQPISRQGFPAQIEWTPRKSKWRAGMSIAEVKADRRLYRLAEARGAVDQRSRSSQAHFRRVADYISELSENGKRAVYDSVHRKVIVLNEAEAELDSSKLLSRLEGIKQLEEIEKGYFAGASGHRYAHALGALYLADRIAKALKLPEQQRRELRLAGLLHDVGHTAFSHGAESITKRHLKAGHEELGERAMRRVGVPKLLKRHGVDFENVVKLSRGEGLGEIVTDYADRIDYLLRDGMKVGVKSEVLWPFKLSVERLMPNFRLQEGKLCVTSAGESEVKKLADVRSKFYSQVYFLPISMLTRHLLRNALEHGIKSKAIRVRDLVEKSDNEIMRKLADKNTPGVNEFGVVSALHDFEQVFALRFNDLPAERRGNLDKLKAEIVDKLKDAGFEGHEFCVGYTPDFEKPVKYRVYDGKKVKEKTYSPKVNDKKKFFFVIAHQNKVEEAKKVLKAHMMRLTKRKLEPQVLYLQAEI